MSQFNRKGYRTLMGQSEPGAPLRPFPVKKGSKLDRKNAKLVKQMKKARRAKFNEYKQELRERKKRVPLAERSKIKLSEFPVRYLNE